MLHCTIRISISDKKIENTVYHEDCVENQKLLLILFWKLSVLTNQKWEQENVYHEEDLRRIIPLHVPKIVGRDDKSTYFFLFATTFGVILIFLFLFFSSIQLQNFVEA